MPAFELFTKPLIDKPGNATADSTPACFCPISVMRLITDSVRSSVAARATARRRRGTACPAPARTRSAPRGSRRTPARSARRRAPARCPRAARPAPRRSVAGGRRPNTQLNPRKNQPPAKSCRAPAHPSWRVRLQQQGAQRRAEGQRVERRDHGGEGDRQRELPVELPVRPLTNAIGTNTRTHSAIAMIARSLHPSPCTSLARRHAQLDVALDVFDNDNRVIDHDAMASTSRRARAR